jgi:hypothetical protein
LCSPPPPQRGDPANLLDVVVREGAAILELLAGENQALLVGGDALLVLDLRLDIVDGVRGLDLEGDGLARQGLHETVGGFVSILSSFVGAID